MKISTPLYTTPFNLFFPNLFNYLKAKFLAFALLLVCLFFLSGIQAQTNYYSKAGNLSPNTFANWGQNIDGTGTAPANFTSANCIYNIRSVTTMTTTATWTVSGTGSKINILTGGTLVASNAVTGTSMAVASGGTYKHNQNAGTIPTATWDPASTCSITGWGASTTAPGGITQTFGNFTWNSTGQTGDVSLAGGLNNVAGNFTVNSTGTTGSLSLGGTGAGNLAIGGDYSQTGGEFSGSLSAARTITITGDFSLTGGTFDLSSTGTAGNAVTVNVAGDFTQSAGTLTESGSSTGSRIVFNGTGTQLYTSGGTLSNLVNFTVNSPATLQMGTGAAPATISNGSTGTFTLASGATLGITSTAGITTTGATGNIQVTGTRTYTAGANYIYNGTSSQVTGNGLTQNTSNDITFNNSAGVILSAATTISGDLLISSGTLSTSGSNFNMSIGGSWTNNGGFTAGTSTETFTGALQTIAGTSSTTFGNVIIASAATYTMSTSNTAGSLTFAASSAASSLTHSSGTFTINGAVTINQPSVAAITSWNINGGTATVSGLISTTGTNTIAAITKIVITGGTLNANGGITFTGTTATNKVIDMSGGSGTINLKGTLTPATSTLTAGTSSTFNYADATAQAINYFSSGAYNNLTTNNATGTTLSGAITATNVTGNLTIQTGIFDNSGLAITLAANKNFTVAAATTFILSGTTSAMPAVSGTGIRTINNTSTVIYSGTGNQTVTVETYGILQLSGSGIKTFAGATTINGDLSINGPTATLAAGTSSTAISLTLGGYGQLAGSWGGATSVATNINTTYFNTSTGIITTSTTPACGTTGLWTGATSTDWNTGTNWCGGAVPGAATNVIIQSGPARQPIIATATTALCNNITINSGASLTLANSATSLLNITGNLTNNGTITQGAASILTFNATSGTQTLKSVSSLSNISHSGAGTVQLLTSALTATGTFTNSAGNFDANGLAATFTGLTTLSGGTYLASTATQTFNGGVTLSGGTFTGSTGAVSTANITVNTGTFTAPSSTLNVTGSTTINGGTYQGAGAQTFNGLTVSGGTFTGSTGSVTAASVTVSSGTLTAPSNTFTVSGLTTVSTGGTYLGNTGAQAFNGGLTVSGIFTGSSGAATATTVTLNSGTLTAPSSTFTISGLTTISGGTYIAGSGASTFNGGVTVSGGTFTGSTGTVTATNVTFSSGTFTAPSGTFNVTGDWANNGGTFTPNGGAVIFTGATQAIGGTVSTTFGILQIDGGSVTTMNINTTCSSLTFIASNTATSLTQAGSTVLIVNGAVTINQPTAAITTAWNINAGTATVSGLITFAGSTATANFINKIVLSTGTLNANGGMTFVTAASANHAIDMTGAATLNLKGALTVPATSSTLTANAASTFNYADATTQIINFFSAGGYGILSTNNAAGATLNAAITGTNVTGNLNIQTGIFNNGGFAIALASGKSFTASANTTFNLTGTSGGITVSGGGTKTYASTSKTNYSGGAQTVTPDTYGNLYLSGSGTKTFSGLTTVVGELNIINTAKATFAAGTVSTANTLTLDGIGQNSGTWGGTSSGATNITTTYFNTSVNGRVSISTSSCSIAGTWLGSISTNWHTAGNWCGGIVPTASTNVVISAGTFFQPTISAAAVCNDITINSGATLTISGSNTLAVSGDWSNIGTFTSGTSTVTFNGSSAQQMSDSSTTTFYNLIINKSSTTATVTSGYPGHAFAIAGALTVTQGNLILQAIDANYLITGDLTVSANGTLTHNVNWDVAGMQITLSGSLIIDGQWVYTVRSHLQMNGVNKTIKTGPSPSALSILTLANTSGTITANGVVTINDNFWAAFNFIGGTFVVPTGSTVVASSALLNSGGTVNITGGSLTVSGGLIMGSTGAPTIPGAVNLSAGTFTVDDIILGSTINTVASTFAQTGGTLLVTNTVTINQPAANTITNTWNIGTATATVNGLITFAGTNTTTSRIGKIILTTGTLNANGGITFVTSAAATKVIDMSGGAGTLNLKGALTVPATSSTLTAGATSNFNYVDAAAQTVNIFSAGAYSNLLINNTNTSTGATLGAAITASNVTGNISVGSINTGSLFTTNNIAITLGSSKSLTIAANSTMNAGTSVVTFGATSTAAINGTFKTANTVGFSGAATTAINSTNTPTISLGANSIIEYNASAVQAVTTRTYTNLVLSGTSNKTFAGNSTISGNFSINGTAIAVLANGTTSTSLTLTLGGVNRVTGSWGSTNVSTPATNKNATYFGTTTTGILNNNASCTGGTWLGGFSTDWNDVGNWCGGIPTSTTDVIISTATYQPVINTAGIVCRNLTLNSAASLTITGSNSLTVSGNWANNGGTFTPNTSTVTFNGTTASIGGSSITTFNNLTISGTTVTATSNINVASDLNITTGIFDLSAFTANRTTAGGTLTIANGATLKIGGTNTIPSNYSTHSIGISSTIEYSGTTQSIITLNSSQNYGNLTTSGSGTKTLSANVGIVGNLSVSAGTLDLSTLTANRTSAGGTLTVSNGATLKIGGTNTIPTNYSTHSIGATSTIEYAGSNQSIIPLNSSQSYGSLVMSGTGTKTLSADISLASNWLRNSGTTFNNNNKIVTFTTTSSSTIKAPESTTKDANGSFGGETFSYLTLNKSAKANTVKILSNICITKTLDITRGTLDMDTSDVVLASNTTTTADVATVNTANADISYTSTGRFIPQRFIGNNTDIRSWRFLTAPFQASDPISINDAWQEGQVNPVVSSPSATDPYPGFGTHITGPSGVYDATKGFDQGSGSGTTSLEYFDNTTGTTKLSYPANTKSTALMSQLGWGLFVRGDRSTIVGNPASSSGNTTLEPKGKINIGDVTSAIVASRTNVVGNPYPCQIDMKNVLIGGLNHRDFKLWDPSAYTNYAHTGRYAFFTWDNLAGVYNQTNGATTIWAYPGTVESSEAFLTYNNVSGTSVVFHESDKVVGVSTGDGLHSRPTGTGTARFQADLQFLDAATNKYNNLSGSNAYFNAAFSNAVVTGEDNVSPVGSALGELRILKDGQQLSTDRQQVIAATDTIFLYLSKANQLHHRLVLSSKYFVPDAQAVLVDKYLDQRKDVAISNTDSTYYEFDITADALSNSSDRFMIVFTPLTTTPVKFSSIKAAQQEKGIAVEWQVSNMLTVKSYEVEKSADGIHFTKVNTTVANGVSASYNWIDASPNSGDNYYRIRIVDQSGVSTYSQVVKVKMGEQQSGIIITSNILQNNIITVQFNDQLNGVYTLALYNQAGQKLESKKIAGNGTWTESVQVKNSLPRGIYNLEINKPGGKKITQQVFVK